MNCVLYAHREMKYTDKTVIYGIAMQDEPASNFAECGVPTVADIGFGENLLEAALKKRN